MEKIQFKNRESFFPVRTTPKCIVESVTKLSKDDIRISDEFFFLFSQLLSHYDMLIVWRKLGKYEAGDLSFVWQAIIESYRKRNVTRPLDNEIKITETIISETDDSITKQFTSKPVGGGKFDKKGHLNSIEAHARKLETLLSSKYPFTSDLIDQNRNAFLPLSQTLLLLAEAASSFKPKDRRANAIFPIAANRKNKTGEEAIQRQFYRNVCYIFIWIFKKPLDDVNATIASILFPEGKITLSVQDVSLNTRDIRENFLK
jgi:hypothetical protein